MPEVHSCAMLTACQMPGLWLVKGPAVVMPGVPAQYSCSAYTPAEARAWLDQGPVVLMPEPTACSLCRRTACPHPLA